MIEPVRLSELFRVRARFCRSVNIVADAGNPVALQGYVVTPLVRSLLRRVSEGLRPGSQTRAWSITGPYGTGKSAFALFMTKVLGYSQNSEARQLLQVVDPKLYAELCRDIPGLAEGGFFITLVLGSREPMAPAIVEALARALSTGQQLISPKAEELVLWLDSLYQNSKLGQQITVAAFTEAVERAAQLVCGSRPEVLGLLIIVDELGKLLEHGTLDPTHGDVFFLQALAELAARSGDYPIGVLTVLHQAFEHYAARLGFLQQQEWAKVQGRFEDMTFAESPGELLKVIGQTIEGTQHQDALTAMIQEEASKVAELGIFPPELGPSEAARILGSCAPLHPTVALVLGRLFRSRLAQNERSLFAFLASGEVHGLRDFLAQETWTGNGYKPFYRLDQLYDYVIAALGSSLNAQSQGKRWAEIGDALDRLPADSSPLEVRLIKTIGLLGLLGDQRRLKSSRTVLIFALADGQGVTDQQVGAAIDRLVDDYNIAVYRRHKDAYGLWEGSDIDLEEQFKKGMASVDRSTSLSELLQTDGYLRPYVAKRHLHETGTLRYFIPWVMDLTQVEEVLSRQIEPADGAIIFVLGTSGESQADILQRLTSISDQLPYGRRSLVFFAVPQDMPGLQEALVELKAWEWVAANTKELHGDNVAREEVRARLMDAQGRVNSLCAKYFDMATSYNSSLWVWGGSQFQFGSPAELSAYLSMACDEAYRCAPTVLNELVNRRTLSSAAAAARRTLIERMLAEPEKPRLGIEGFPPELSMYRSVLERSGLHHPAGDTWEFGVPSGPDACNVGPLWQAIDDFLNTTQAGKRTVLELFELLRRPPYGIRDGLLPVFLASAMIHWDEDIAVYEDGTFIPKIDIAAFERLMKAPGTFAVQRYRLGDARSYLFDQYSGLFKAGQDTQAVTTLLGAIRPIIAFVKQLPPYTTRTRSLSREAITVREAIMSAKEPHRLLFSDLPQALETDPQAIVQEQRSAEVFFSKLKGLLRELERAYDMMVDRSRVQLFDALRAPVEEIAARRELTNRAMAVQDKISDLRLKAFVMRLGDIELSDGQWLESVLSSVATKSPKQWNDQDVLHFGISLAEIAGHLRRVEEIVAQNSPQTAHGSDGRIVRLGFTTESGEDRSTMVHISSGNEADIEQLANKLEAELNRLPFPRRIIEAAVAELVRRALALPSQRESRE